MDAQRFDAVTRLLGRDSTRRRAVALVAGLLAAPTTSTATRAAKKKGKKKGKEKGKVGVCHRTGSATNPVVFIRVSAKAAKAHRVHGDAINPDFDNDPNNCGRCGISCTGDEACLGGTCHATCASYGASACQTPTTVCDPNIVTCGGDSNCWAMPTTGGCCACSTPPGRSHQTCTSDANCVNAALCSPPGPIRRCNGDNDISCTSDADCASLATCQDGECGGPICTTDADCEEALGPGTVCISGAELPCTAGGANICWTLCTGA